MKTLCLYYTRTNTTKAAMEHLAKLLDADLAEYTDGKDRSGILGYIGACFVSEKKVVSQISIKEDIQLDGYETKIKALDEILGRPSAGQISLRTKEHDYIKDIETFAEQMK